LLNKLESPSEQKLWRGFLILFPYFNTKMESMITANTTADARAMNLKFFRDT